MKASFIPYAICSVMIFFPPVNGPSIVNSIYIAVLLFLFYTFSTLYFVPYSALQVEVVSDPQRRVFFYAINSLLYVVASALAYTVYMIKATLTDRGFSYAASYRIPFVVFGILGMLVWLILTIINPKRKRGYYHGAILTHWKFSFSTGLGMFIFYGHADSDEAAEVLVHEYGHTIQSIILGPLFMLVTGIPSCVWAFTPVFGKWRKEGRYKYTDFYPECWANKLGEKILKQPATWR